MEKVPQYPSSLRPFKMQKKLKFMRGPETVHNTLLHKQYGIIVSLYVSNNNNDKKNLICSMTKNIFKTGIYNLQATGGGRLKSGHFEMIRMTLLRNFDFKNMFAIWRVDAPWQPITKKVV